MNTGIQLQSRKPLVWSIAGISLGAFISTNPFHAPAVPLAFGIAAWPVTMTLVLVLSARPVGARIGALLSGVLWAIPCYVQESPLARFALMCCMAAPVAIATALLLVPPIKGIRSRLAYLLTWCDTQKVKHCPHHCDWSALSRLAIATAILAAAIMIIKFAVTPSALPLRWLAGGIAVLAFAEMTTAAFPFLGSLLGIEPPPLMRSPYRSASVSEFWARRWNVWTSEKVFLPYCYKPLARRGIAVALFVTFAFSGLGHLLLTYMALGKWSISLVCGTFFLVQPVLITAERRFGVRRWKRVRARAWTLGILAIVSPLFVEPALQIVEGGWGAPDNVLGPTLVTLGFVISVCAIIALATQFSSPKPGSLNAAGAQHNG